MREEIIKRNIAVILSGILVFFVVMEFVTNYFNRKQAESNLYNMSMVIKNRISEDDTPNKMKNTIDSFTINQDWLEIKLAEMDGRVIKDSDNDAIGDEIIIYLTEKEIDRAMSYDINENKVYIENGELYYINEINSIYILKISTKYALDTSYMLLSAFVMLIILIVSVILSAFLSKRLSLRFLGTLKEMSNHLSTINEGEYKEISLYNNYPELDSFIDEINEINENISLSIERIKNEKNKQNFIINNIFQGIIIVDEFKNILLINNLAKELLKTEDLKNDTTSYLKYFDDEELRTTISRSISNKGNYSFDRIDVETGKIYYFQTSYLKNKWNEPNMEVGLTVTTITDVTEDRLNDKKKKEFITNASHELKTPITSIRGFAELLQLDDDLSEKTKKHIDIIYNETIKMKETIDNLMYLSSIENKKEEEKEKVYLDDIVNEAIESYGDAAFKKGVKFTTDIDDSYVYTGRSMIYHLVSNLIDNAVKYNKTNGFVIIQAKKTESSIVLTVSDTGIGIETKNLDRIFDRFYRVEKSRNRDSGGSGLGLNIVKEIANSIDAKIEVESTFGIGTTFKVTFNKGE